MKKKTISIFMAVIVAFSCLALSFNAYGKIQGLILDVDFQDEIDGEDDLVWFSYTPDASGTYSFLSYNVPASEAYLFIKETDSATNTKQYVQLAYSNSDPNYQANGHNSRQFCLTYHLEEGVKYYFAAGWYLSETRVTGAMKVKLRCDRYDEEIDRIEAYCNATLDAYSDGSWQYDTDNNLYYFYNISKIVANTTVTIYYLDGTSSSVTGEEAVDGYSIVYNHNQSRQHWYPESDENYSGNTINVKVLDKTTQLNVKINTTARYSVKGRVIDLTGYPVSNAKIIYGNTVIAQADENGAFSFYATAGKSEYTISAENAVDRKIFITVSSVKSNDYNETPIEICTCDYKKDGIVNAKDFAIMSKAPGEEGIENQREQFSQAINFTAQDYPLLVLE